MKIYVKTWLARALKIEGIKELIIFGEETFAEIIHKLNYSSAAHLSNQFKKKSQV